MSLPGVNTVIRDRFIQLSRTDIPLGPKVVILGRRYNTASDTSSGVADLDPYNAVNEAGVINAFGEGSDLHRGYIEALAGGATRVTLIALPADTVFNHGDGTITSDDYDTATDNEGDLFADAFAAVEATQADIVVPYGRGAGFPEFDPDTDPDMYGATPDYDNEIGFHADNIAGTSSWAYKVAQKCAEITHDSHPCFAVMGIAPFVGPSTGGMTPAQVNTHLQLTNLSDHNSTSFESYGPYLSVVAAEIAPIGYNTRYNYGFSNGAAMYAGYITQLDSWSAPTGKAIFNVSQLRYNPTKTQQQALVNKGVVPVALNFNRIPTWVDAQTFAKETSDYTRLTTFRIVFDTVQMVRSVAQIFIGEASTVETRNAIETQINSGLRTMAISGALLASNFTVSYIPSESKAIVDLVLTPAFELRNIEVRIAINLG